MKKYYVYTFTLLGIVIYVGKGIGDRIDLEERNDWYNLLRGFFSQGEIREKVAKHLTEREALTLEAQLIKKYNPMFNKTQGLTPQKWVELTKKGRKELLKDQVSTSIGVEGLEPFDVAQEIVSNLKPILYNKVLIVGNDGFGGVNLLKAYQKRYGTLSNITFITNEKGGAYIMNENIKGISVINTDFLEYDFKDQRFDLVLMNPPFGNQSSLANKFVEHALTITDIVGAIIPTGINSNIRSQIETYNIYDKKVMNIATHIYGCIVKKGYTHAERMPVDPNLVNEKYLAGPLLHAAYQEVTETGLYRGKGLNTDTLAKKYPKSSYLVITSQGFKGLVTDMPTFIQSIQTLSIVHIHAIEATQDTFEDILKATKDSRISYGTPIFNRLQGK